MYQLGAQLEGPLGEREKYLKSMRVYHFPVRWDEIELQPGVYTWPAYAEDNIRRMNAILPFPWDWQFIIGTRTCPPFYAAIPGRRNSPPKPEHYQDYARFIEALIREYSPDGVELWNEPEFPAEAVGNLDYIMGGFGTDGGSYGAMVRTVYDYIKPNYPNVALIAGASIGPNDMVAVKNFLAMAAGAGMLSDYWSFHAYVYYGEVYGKPYKRRYADVIRLGNEAYDILPIPQIISECSLMRMQTLPEDAGHRDEQARYLDYLLRHRDAMPVESILWYTLADNGWRHTDLCYGGVEYPAYKVWSDYA